MPLTQKFHSLVRNVLFRKRAEAELDREMHAHLELLIEERLEAGMAPEEAERAAKMELGGAEQVKEQVRDRRIGEWFSLLATDCRYGVRQLRKNPGFTAVAVLALALGIGANTAIFSNLDALILRPFALPEADRVVAVWETVPKQDAYRVSAAPANFHDWLAQNRSFQSMAALHGWDANLTGEGVAEHVEGYQVTQHFFTLMGVPMELGRPISGVDFQQGSATVAVLSDRFWRGHLAGDPRVIGKDLLLNGQKFTVIGVANSDLDMPTGVQLWTPLDLRSQESTNRSDHYLFVVGRLGKGASMASATADLESVAARLGQAYPDTNAGHGVRVLGLAGDATEGTASFVAVLMGCAVFVLLLACANIANLQLARASTRQKEMAIRAGMGASRWRLVRQLLVESTLLALTGGVAGVLLAKWGIQLMRRDLPTFILEHVPGLKHVEVDGRTLLFTLGVAVASGILTGLAPALRFSRGDLNDALKENARSSTAGETAGRLRGLLVAFETALALILLVGAGLMVNGFHNLLTAKMGFDRGNVLTFHVVAPKEKYQTKEQVKSYYERVLEQLRALPSVESAACVSSLPSSRNWNWTEYTAEGQPAAQPGELRTAISQMVTPEFMTTLRVPLVEGRFLSPLDGPDAAPVAVVSESLARAAWPNQDAIGKHMRLGNAQSTEPERRVVGVVGDVNPSAFTTKPEPTAYVPFAQAPQWTTSIAVRTAGDPLRIAPAVAEIVRGIDPTTPAYDIRTLRQVVADDLSGVESAAQMMIVFGGIALVLAGAGIFAVMAYSVTQRTHEIGIRMALGARPKDVLRLVVSNGMKMALLGLTVGLGASLLLARAIASVLYGVIRVQPLVFVALTGTLAIVASVAAYVPARWATKVDPMRALRCD